MKRFPKFDPKELTGQGYKHPGYTPQRMKQIEAIAQAMALISGISQTN